MNRRRLLDRMLRTGLLGLGALDTAAAETGPRAGAPTQPPAAYPPVTPGRTLEFPRDFGAHPEWRTEWWYVTGWLRSGDRDLGVQVTFFRSRTRHPDANPSRFAPRQLLLAHVAIADPARGRLVHDQVAAREGFGLASASRTDTDLHLLGWRLWRSADDVYHAVVESPRISLDLRFAPGAPPVLQGAAGYSRKGPRPEQASYYYSRPQLRVEGRIAVRESGAGSAAIAATAPGPAPTTRAATPVGGFAWLDHEWSSELLDPDATGWDWAGLNFDDGSALMAFRIRSRSGATIWSTARWLRGTSAGAADPAARFEPVRQWRSPRSGASYPTQMRLHIGARVLELRPLFDDQELDARASTGTIYWEGAVRVFDGSATIGAGYLELTGYASPMRL